MIIQLYAVTSPKEAVQFAQMGVDHIGFIAGRYDLVPGELNFKEARAICDAVSSQATKVALTMSTDVEEILRMLEEVRPDILHISTDVEDVPEQSMEVLRKRLDPTIKLMKAIPVGGVESLEYSRRFASLCDLFLLDSKVINMPGVGATGRVHDWGISRQIVKTCGIPVILAGGLSAENVADAIRQVQPWGVDSNTHTNMAGDPVLKDPQRVADFIAAVRSN